MVFGSLSRLRIGSIQFFHSSGGIWMEIRLIAHLERAELAVSFGLL